MTKKLLAFLCMVLLASPAAADKEAKVKELIQLSSGNFNQIEQVLSQVFEPVMMNIKCTYAITDIESTEIQRKFMDLLDLRNTMDSYIPFYITHFTEEEIDEILKFQKSTAGKKMVTLQPQLAQFMLQQQQKVIQDVEPKIKAIVNEVESKYTKRSQADYHQCMSLQMKRK